MKPFLQTTKELTNSGDLPSELTVLREKMKKSIREKGVNAAQDFVGYYKELLMWSMATGQDVGAEIHAAKELWKVSGISFAESDGKDLSDFAKKMKLKIG